MTRQQFFEIAGYFANPIRHSRIEIEARENTINNYASYYLAKTGLKLPLHTDSVTILANDANKWGREMRLYFIVTNEEQTPALVKEWMTVGGRPGYELWTQRLNSKDIIDELFEVGFILGYPQNVERIRALISEEDMVCFNIGFDAL